MDVHLRKFQEGHHQRRDAINALHFTYRGLQRLMPTMVRRSEGLLERVLMDQQRVDRAVDAVLVDAAVGHGHPPRSCVCQEAGSLLGELYHADRTPAPLQRNKLLVHALRNVRAFLVRTYTRLLEALPDEVHPALRATALELQQREADQHRELVGLGELLLQWDGTERRTA
ncbi:MAG TPA: hypothetical protein VGE21_13445 [Flavobacteriales bacterium]